MAKKYLVPSIILSCASICLVIGIITPIVLEIIVTAEIKDKLVLTKDNNHHFWGEIPGKIDALVTQHYHMFNLTNPEEVMQGGVPIVDELSGYKYQEFDKFLNISYGDHVDYNLYRYAKRTSKLPWASDISESDMITSISVGAFGGWDIVKHFSRQQLALAALYLLAGGFEQQLPVLSYSIGMSKFLVSEHVASLTIFAPAGLTPEQGSNIWNDQMYGMGSSISLQWWVIAMQENLNSTGGFELAQPLTGTMYVLSMQFGLNANQLNGIFTGHLFTSYSLITLMFFVNYECPNGEIEYMCDPIYLAGLQWSQSAITLSPPASQPMGPSIASINSSVDGYPEMYYFYTATTASQKFSGYNFTPADYAKLFNYNRTTGYPLYDPYTLMDVGQMNLVFQYGQNNDFDGLGQMLDMSSSNARLIWDYLNGIVDFAGLQSCYDPDIYDTGNRGLSGEASLGQLGSQTLYNFTVFMSETLLINITAIYDYLRLNQLNVTCNGLVQDNLGPGYNVCNVYDLQWQDGGISLWIQVYWTGPGTDEWDTFAQYANLTDSEMQTLFGSSSTLYKNFSMFDGEIKTHYSCPNYGNRCDPWFLTNKQWGQSYVTLNLPSIFATVGIENSASISNYPFFNSKYSGTPEYSAFALKKGKPIMSNDTLVNNLLSFGGMYTTPLMQKYFIYIFAQNFSGIQSFFGIQDVDTFTAYLRYFIDLYFFGGLIKPKTVEDILFTDLDPLSLFMQNLNPLQGGNPAQNIYLTRVGLNMSFEQVMAPGPDFRHRINAGKKDIDNLRKYSKIYGADYISFPLQVYNGQNETGGMNLSWVHQSPWAGEIPAWGTDGWMFRPFLSDDDVLHYYLDIGGFPFIMEFDEHKTHKGYSCLEYVINNEVLQNSTTNPKNTILNQFGPDGLANETGIFQAPVFGAKPYFYQGDQALYDMIQWNQPSLKTKDNCESNFVVEKHTGVVLAGKQLIMYALEIKPDILYPYLGLQNLQNFGHRTYMPFVTYERDVHIPQHKIDDKIGLLKTIPKVRLAGQIVGYSLGGIFLILGIWLCWRRRKNRLTGSSVGQSLIIK